MYITKLLWEELYLKPEFQKPTSAEIGTSIHQSLENYYTSLLKNSGSLKDQKKD